MPPTTRGMAPVPPGRFARNMCTPEGLTVSEIAKHLGVSRQSLYALFNESRRLTPEMAKKFEIAFGISSALMLRQQANYEAWQTDQRIDELAEGVTPWKGPEAA